MWFYRFSQNEMEIMLKEGISPSVFSTAPGLRTRYCYISSVVSILPMHFLTQGIFARDLEGLTWCSEGIRTFIQKPLSHDF